MAHAAMAAMAAGAIIKGVGTVKAGVYNKRLANRQADEALMIGVEEERRIRQAARGAMGQQVGAMAASGFEIGSGSALGAIEESLINREVDIMNSRRNYGAKAAGLREQGRLAKREAVMTAVADGIQAAASMAGPGGVGM